MEGEENIAENGRTANDHNDDDGTSVAVVSSSSSSSSSQIPTHSIFSSSSMASIASDSTFFQLTGSPSESSNSTSTRASALRTIPGTTNFGLHNGTVEEHSYLSRARWWTSSPSPSSSSSASASPSPSASSSSNDYQNRAVLGSQLNDMSESEDQSSYSDDATSLVNEPLSHQVAELVWNAANSTFRTHRSRHTHRLHSSHSDGDNYSNADTEELMPHLAAARVPHRGNSVSDCSQCSANSDDDDAEESKDPLAKWLYPV